MGINTASRRTPPAQNRVSREQRHSQRVLTLATSLFVLCSGFAVYVLSTMVTTTLTELVYLVDTTCVVHKITLHDEPVPCIVPTCGNILTQSGCRQTGYCIRAALNFSIKDEHAKLLKMPVEHTSSAPMLELKLHDQYKRAYGDHADGTGGIPCVGFKAGVEGDRKCRPTKTYDTALYTPSVAVTVPAAPTDVAEADGRKLELLDPTDSGRCFAISCREDGARARREALQLMSYWPEGSTLSSCHYLRSFNPVRTVATLPTPTSDPTRPTPRHPTHSTTVQPPLLRCRWTSSSTTAAHPSSSRSVSTRSGLATGLPRCAPAAAATTTTIATVATSATVATCQRRHLPAPPLPPLPARLPARPAHPPTALQSRLPAAHGGTRTALASRVHAVAVSARAQAPPSYHGSSYYHGRRSSSGSFRARSAWRDYRTTTTSAIRARATTSCTGWRGRATRRS